MGNYCELYISNYPVYSTKYYVDQIIMTIFRESDKKIYNRFFSQRNKIEWGHAQSEGDDFEELAVEYSVSAREVKERLDLMGFTTEKVKLEFSKCKNERLEELSQYESDLWKEDYELLKNSDIDDFIKAYQTIINSGINPVHFIEKYEYCTPLHKYILINDEYYWGFFCEDLRCLIRILVDISPEEYLVVQDFTDLVSDGTYKKDDNICEMSLNELKGKYSINSKIIVLTEGISDAEILEPFLKLRYPHLSDYFSFLNFDYNMPGGVGSLINTVKTFAGSGIENRIVAIFDNDTAAFSAIESIKNLSLPGNITVTHYPDIEFANNYPTIGPNGLLNQNINGLACSIELYLGKDVLTDNGDLIPVQWKGYDAKLKRYQGEILNKDSIKKKYFLKLDQYRTDKFSFDKESWNNMEILFKHLFNVFNA